MIKKLFLLLITITAAVAANAQHTPGSWRVIPMSGTGFEDVLDTPGRVYYLSGSSLYAFDKEANETIFFSPGSKISDSGITGLYYNPNGKYTVCVYSNCNIDLLYDNGKVVNLPEIKNASLTATKGIKEVSFGKNRIYIATTFGIVIYDDTKHQVIESGIYNTNVNSIQEMGDKILIVAKTKPDDPDNYYLSWSPVSERHNTLSKFKPIQTVGMNGWINSGDNSYLAMLNNVLWKVTVNFDKNTCAFVNKGTFEGAKIILPSDRGFVITGTKEIVIIDNEANVIEKVAVPADFKDNKLAMWNSGKSVWAADKDGIGCYDFSGSTPVEKSQKYFPQSSKQFNNKYYCYTPSGNVVFGGVGFNYYHPFGQQNDPFGGRTPILVEEYDWEYGDIISRFPYVTKQYSTNTTNYNKNTNTNLMMGGPGQMVVDPVDPTIIYQTNNWDGLAIIKDREVKYVYDRTNSPIHTGSGTRAFDVTFDPFGNLWVGEWRGGSVVNTSTSGTMKVIPKESLKLLRNDFGALSEKDASGQYKHWLQPAWVPGNTGTVSSLMRFSNFCDKALYVGGTFEYKPIGYDTRGTSDVSDDRVMEYGGFIDQDGNVLHPTYQTALEEDQKGAMWIGTSSGVYVVDNMDVVCNPTDTYLPVRRPKVPRNDGTQYADFLLSTDKIMGISVDANNRKWIATEASGLYFVNENGTEILANYTTANSPLVTNCVTMVAADPHSNDVLVGTPNGLYVYSSDSAPAADDYSEVYAFPNPVRPDYTGWITINGLMDNSLIKIADSQGNVIQQMKSEGGMATWDGCDAAGNRVRSGVYLVFASQTDGSNSSGVVTKIVVIK